MFVKPANLGSSIGISRADTEAELRPAIELAQSFDEYLVFEESIQGREIEVAVLGDRSPEASLPGEIVCGGGFYGFEEKYRTPDTKLLIPAPLSDHEIAEAQALAIRTFKALRADGMARVDLFYDGKDSSSSMRSTRFPASRPSPCTRCCGKRAGSATPPSSIGWSIWRCSGTSEGRCSPPITSRPVGRIDPWTPITTTDCASRSPTQDRRKATW